MKPCIFKEGEPRLYLPHQNHVRQVAVSWVHKVRLWKSELSCFYFNLPSFFLTRLWLLFYYMQSLTLWRSVFTSQMYILLRPEETVNSWAFSPSGRGRSWETCWRIGFNSIRIGKFIKATCNRLFVHIYTQTCFLLTLFNSKHFSPFLFLCSCP